MKIFICVLISIIASCERRSIDTKKSNSISENSSEHIEAEIVKSFQTSWNLNGIKMTNIWLFDNQEDSISLGHLIKQNSNVILFFSQNACLQCIDSTLNKIAMFNKTHGAELNLSIVSNLADRTIYTLLLYHGIKNAYYSIYNQNLGFDPIEFSGPIFFVLDRDLIIQNAFKPIDFQGNLTIRYLDNIYQSCKMN
jgi:hypothetical protein